MARIELYRTASQPVIHPSNALHFYEQHAPQDLSRRSSSISPHEAMPPSASQVKLPSIQTSLNLPNLSPQIVGSGRATALEAMQSLATASAQPKVGFFQTLAIRRYRAEGVCVYQTEARALTNISANDLAIPPPERLAARAIAGLPAYAWSSVSSSTGGSPPPVHDCNPTGAPFSTSVLPDATVRSSSQPAQPASQLPVSSSTNRSTDLSLGVMSSGRASLSLGSIMQYLDSQYHDHPAHQTKSKSESVKAMAGEAGRAPTLVEIKKGLQ